MGLDELVSREVIREMLASYALAADRGAIDELLNLYAQDAVLETPRETVRGRTALERYYRSYGGDGKPRPRMRHLITTSKITFATPDDAHAWTYFQVTAGGLVEEAGVYVDRFRLQADGWRLAARRIKADELATRS